MSTDQSSILSALPETPFAELQPTAETEEPETVGLLPWTESPSPFAEAVGTGFAATDELTDQFVDTFEEFRDEAFDEALAELVAETSEAASVEGHGEALEGVGDRREQLAAAHLGPIESEAEQCIQRFIDHVGHTTPETMSEAELDRLLEGFDPGPASLSPAGEQFLGGLIKKAKSVVKSVARVASDVVGKLPFLGPILDKLKGLVKPLLRRVLGMAIGRLPAALQPTARGLAAKLGIAETESFDELEEEAAEESLAEGFAGAPVGVLDPETLAESFDAALAEAVVSPEAEEGEAFGPADSAAEQTGQGTELERLAAARGRFITGVQSAGPDADLGPVTEQFIPAILPALKLGLRLIGRSKVVNFLAKYVAGLISKWVGPALAQQLSRSLVDVGLGVIGLESGGGSLEAETAPAMLAATVEDTVRRVAEQPDHVLEDETLMQLAVAEAFEQAVAANFPAPLVRPDLRPAPTLGGTFVTRHPRSPHAYKKFTRTPEIEVTAAQAAAVRTFGGTTLDSALRARGFVLPARFRVEIFEAGIGTTLPTLARMEHLLGPGETRGAYGRLHPLTTAAATTLLREPKLGVDVPSRFLQSRHRIAVGQRFFCLRPVGQSPVAAAPVSRSTTNCDATTPSDRRMRIDVGRDRARLALYFAEPDAQQIAAAMAADRTSPVLLKALLAALRASGRAVGRSDGAVRMRLQPKPTTGFALRRGESELERSWEAQWENEMERRAWASRPPRRHHHRVAPAQRAALRRRIHAAAGTALSSWTRSHGQEFVRATQDARCGVTVLITVQGLRAATPNAAAVDIRVVPGRHRP
ncbi:hypothetical protein QSJ18_18060 [Gordonia sp. ABSL1-1]|uniref:hypothetical protein n=1 Tax=Gordonia sp. ABSL1-1 TaxID=3053923 RepID=UPI0025734464|nr:hypothetical protein [Gordonia sp. ABSL1-1]MDL9938654.1 hypothetical protein [Gordonia sp. ABSL1-1]